MTIVVFMVLASVVSLTDASGGLLDYFRQKCCSAKDDDSDIQISGAGVVDEVVQYVELKSEQLFEALVNLRGHDAPAAPLLEKQEEEALEKKLDDIEALFTQAFYAGSRPDAEASNEFIQVTRHWRQAATEFMRQAVRYLAGPGIHGADDQALRYLAGPGIHGADDQAVRYFAGPVIHGADDRKLETERKAMQYAEFTRDRIMKALQQLGGEDVIATRLHSPVEEMVIKWKVRQITQQFKEAFVAQGYHDDEAISQLDEAIASWYEVAVKFFRGALWYLSAEKACNESWCLDLPSELNRRAIASSRHEPESSTVMVQNPRAAALRGTLQTHEDSKELRGARAYLQGSYDAIRTRALLAVEYDGADSDAKGQ